MRDCFINAAGDAGSIIAPPRLFEGNGGITADGVEGVVLRPL
jgi:hypothetical protein